MFVIESTFDDENLFSTPVRVVIEGRFRRPSYQCNVLTFIIVQTQNFEARYKSGRPLRIARIDDELRLVCSGELMQLDEDYTTPLANFWRMCCADGVSYVAARRVQLMLITKLTLQHEKLLATSVYVRRKCTAGSISDQRRRARDFVADAIEHHALDARHRRVHPFVIFRSNNYALREVRVKPH